MDDPTQISTSGLGAFTYYSKNQMILFTPASAYKQRGLTIMLPVLLRPHLVDFSCFMDLVTDLWLKLLLAPVRTGG